jgi:hypothetical protein
MSVFRGCVRRFLSVKVYESGVNLMKNPVDMKLLAECAHRNMRLRSLMVDQVLGAYGDGTEKEQMEVEEFSKLIDQVIALNTNIIEMMKVLEKDGERQENL